MAREHDPKPAGKFEGEQPKRGTEPGESKSSSPEDKPDDREFGADDDTPQQGGM